MAGRDGITNFIHSKVYASRSLVLKRLRASDRQAKCSGHRIDVGPEGIEIRDGCKQFETTEALATDSRYATSTSKMPCSLKGSGMLLKEWNASSPVRVSDKTPTQIVTRVVTAIPYGTTLMPTLSFSSTQLARTRSIDECRMFCWLRNSTTPERTSVRGLLRFEKVTNFRTNSSLQIVFARFVAPADWQKPHETRILLWPRGRCEDILGCTEDRLGTPAPGTPDTAVGVSESSELGE